VRLEGLGKLKKYVHLIGSRTLDLPACGTVPQPLRYRVLKPEYIPSPSLLSVTQLKENSRYLRFGNSAHPNRPLFPTVCGSGVDPTAKPSDERHFSGLPTATISLRVCLAITTELVVHFHLKQRSVVWGQGCRCQRTKFSLVAACHDRHFF
jgi:hypothetical protein